VDRAPTISQQAHMTDPVVPYVPVVVDPQLAEWLVERADLTTVDHFKTWLRKGLELLPGVGFWFGGYFDTLDSRHARKVEETVTYLHSRLAELAAAQDLAVRRDYFSTDEFATLFEECWRRILAEAQLDKLAALRNALLSVIVCRPSFAFEKKHFFVRSLDGMAETHLRLLQILHTKFGTEPRGVTLSTQELWDVLGAQAPSELEYVNAVLDLLANRRFVDARTIPQREEGRIDRPLQRFALTSLGAEFLQFIRHDRQPPNSREDS